MRHFILTLLLLMLSAGAALATDPAAPAAQDITASDAFVSAVAVFEAGDYEQSAARFEALLKTAPRCARCAHLLGRSYGHLAEEAGWLKAIGLAKKTRQALEQAVALAPQDDTALRDLIAYYRMAPGFLGGDPRKAERLERSLENARNDRNS